MGRASHIGAFSAPSAEDETIAADALARVGISHLADRPCTGISGGEWQFVQIARAIVQCLRDGRPDRAPRRPVQPAGSACPWQDILIGDAMTENSHDLFTGDGAGRMDAIAKGPFAPADANRSFARPRTEWR